MLERLTNLGETYQYRLGAAFTMEHTVLEILDDAVEEAHDEQVEKLFVQHRSETDGHVRNLEEVFGLLGWPIEPMPCPAIDGLQAEGKANATKAAEAAVDAVLLETAAAVEHYEIATYESLIGYASAAGHKDVAELLEQNLGEEQQTLKLVGQAHGKLVAAALAPERGLLGKLKSAVSK